MHMGDKNPQRVVLGYQASYVLFREVFSPKMQGL